MLLRHIGRAAAAEKLEKALENCPDAPTGTADGNTAAAYTDSVIKML
jgi:hypothetical protein